MKKINLFLLILIFINSCGDLGKVLRNEKIRTTDEFLVKKKGPLVLPPDYDVIPEPDSITENKITEEEQIRKILKTNKTKIKNKKSSSTEEKILDKIKK